MSTYIFLLSWSIRPVTTYVIYCLSIIACTSDNKHPLCKVLVYGCRSSATCDLSGSVTCEVEMSLGRQCIWLAGQDLGTVVSKVITHFMWNEVVLWRFFNFCRTSNIRPENCCFISVHFILSLICLEMPDLPPQSIFSKQ